VTTSTTGRAQAGWLRKYYPDGIDEPHFDATPAVEKALAWVRSLGEREFVGTESPRAATATSSPPR
jgi:hypothetical protein